VSLKNLETALLGELRKQPGCALLKMGDVRQWDDDPFEPQAGETLVFLPDNKKYVAYLPGASAPKGRVRR
jgi:hypothetical protein